MLCISVILIIISLSGWYVKYGNIVAVKYWYVKYGNIVAVKYWYVKYVKYLCG